MKRAYNLSVLMIVIVVTILLSVIITSLVKDNIHDRERKLLLKYPPTGLNQVVSPTFSKNNSDDKPGKDYQENEFSAQEKNIPGNIRVVVGDIVWEGRYVENEDKDSYANYRFELVKIQNNIKEIIYKSAYNASFDENHFEVDENILIFHADSGGPEGVAPTTIVFKEGNEIFRSYYSTYGPYLQQFKIQWPDSPEYSIDLNISRDCSEYYNERYKTEDGRYIDAVEILDTETTEILGLNIQAKKDSETFLLEEPITVRCFLIDGGIHNPTILNSNIETSVSGVNFKIADNTYVYITIDKKTKKPELSFYDI